MAEKTEAGQWQWQTEGTSWKGIGIYHVTLTVTSRAPLLGTLVIPDNDPAQASVERTELGRALLNCQRSISVFHPEIQILQYCLMPDHLHSIWYVRRPMQQSIRYVAQGFWRAAKKVGRAYSYLNSRLAGGTTDENIMQTRLTGGAMDEKAMLAEGWTTDEKAMWTEGGALLFRCLRRLAAVRPLYVSSLMAKHTAVLILFLRRCLSFARCLDVDNCRQ